MKRFLVFVIVCIVTASVGLMTYKFLTLEETILFNRTVFEINVGEDVPLEITRVNAKPTTEIYFESLQPDIVYYDRMNEVYRSGIVGGQATLKVSSNLPGFVPQLITVKVGNGSSTSPYFVRDAVELASIGVERTEDDQIKRPLDKCYKLITDINLAVYNDGVWIPLANGEEGFSGRFDFGMHTINGLNITETTESAGLFAKIEREGSVDNLILIDTNINGEFDYAGAVAGFSNGSINRVKVLNSTVSSSKNEANVGGVAGYMSGTMERVSVENSTVSANGQLTLAGGIVGRLETIDTLRAIIQRSYASATNVSGGGSIGGIAGKVQGALVINSYAAQTLESEIVKGILTYMGSTPANARVGGIAGEATATVGSLETLIVDTYSSVKVQAEGSQRIGAIVGYNVDADRSNLRVNKYFGNYFDEIDSGSSKSVGYVEGVGTATDSLYEFMFNTLKTETGFYSHRDYSTMKDYYWIIGQVWVLRANGYPLLNMEGDYVDLDTMIGSLGTKEEIKTVPDLMTKLRADLNGSYILAADLDLSGISDWSPIGTKDNPFNGKFTCQTDEYGNPLWSITGLRIASSEVATLPESDSCKGLFGYVSRDATIENIVMKNMSIERGTTVGGLVAVNYGVVNNCSVEVVGAVGNKFIKTNSVGIINGDSNVYVGGIVGLNFGRVINSKNMGPVVEVTNQSATTFVYVGGIVGLNETSGYITNVRVMKHQQIASEEGNLHSLVRVNVRVSGYVGGVVGLNKNSVTKSYFSADLKVLTSNDLAFVGGVAGMNSDQGLITTSFSDGLVEGWFVGGVAGINTGRIAQCYAEGTLTGKRVGGLVFTVSNGKVSDSYSAAQLLGTGAESVKCGLAYSVSLVSEDPKNASMVNCFSRSTFGGEGTNWYECTNRVREDTYWVLFREVKRDAGYLINCIYDREVAPGSKRSIYGTGDSFWQPAYQWIISIQNVVYLDDCGLTTAECKGANQGHDVFRGMGFNENLWKLETGNYPTLRNVVTK